MKKLTRKDIEEILRDAKTPPKRKPRGIPFKSKLVNLPVEVFLKKMGLNADLGNYRKHTLRGNSELADSIEKTVLIQQVQVNYDTKKDVWNFSDGRGRFWSIYQKGFSLVPTEIFYDVPENLWTEISINANATKTKISSEDIALFSNRLLLLLERYVSLDSGRMNVLRQEQMDLELLLRNGNVNLSKFSRLIGRDTDTVRGYIIFARADSVAVKHVLDHPKEKNYSMLRTIAERIKEPIEQRKFYFYVLHKQQENYEKAKEALKNSRRFKGQRLIKRMPHRKFLSELDNRVKELYEKKDFELTSPVHNGKNGGEYIHRLLETTIAAKKHVDALTKLAQNSEEFRSQMLKSRVGSYEFGGYDNMLSYIQTAIHNCNKIISNADESLQDKIESMIAKPKKKTFEERILATALAHKKSGYLNGLKLVHTLGDKIHYLPVEKVRLAKVQLRKHYDYDAINRLADSMKKYGQRGAGTVHRMDGHYEVVVGSNRLKAVRIAGIPYYKAIINNSLSKMYIALLQCMEDLHEQDTILERATALAKRYHAKLHDLGATEKIYTPEKFAAEHEHLASRRTTLNAIMFDAADNAIKELSASKIISYEDAIKIAGLPKELQFEAAYSLMVHNPNISVLAAAEHSKSGVHDDSGNPSNKTIDAIVGRLKLRDRSESLFEIADVNYDLIFKSFADNLAAPYNYFRRGITAHNNSSETLKFHKSLYYSCGKLVKSLKQLEQEIMSRHSA